MWWISDSFSNGVITRKTWLCAILGAVFGECRGPCMLKTICLDFGKEISHCSLYKKQDYNFVHTEISTIFQWQWKVVPPLSHSFFISVYFDMLLSLFSFWNICPLTLRNHESINISVSFWNICPLTIRNHESINISVSFWNICPLTIRNHESINISVYYQCLVECYSTLSELQCAVASEFGRWWIRLKCSFKDGLLSIDLDVILVKDEYECDYDPITMCIHGPRDICQYHLGIYMYGWNHDGHNTPFILFKLLFELWGNIKVILSIVKFNMLLISILS